MGGTDWPIEVAVCSPTADSALLVAPTLELSRDLLGDRTMRDASTPYTDRILYGQKVNHDSCCRTTVLDRSS